MAYIRPIYGLYTAYIRIPIHLYSNVLTFKALQKFPIIFMTVLRIVETGQKVAVPKIKRVRLASGQYILLVRKFKFIPINHIT